MAQGVYKITEQFEKELCKYTGAPYAVAVDNGSNALFLALMWDDIRDREITIPSRTYPSVPCAVIHAGGKVRFRKTNIGTFINTLKGAYLLEGSNVVDSALCFTADMYDPGKFMCLSFTGHHKHLNLGKGGAILTDNEGAYKWFKRARFSGRRECPYSDDSFDMLGWNFYMPPETATRGLMMMKQFYNINGTKKRNEDIELPYPDLSQFKIYDSIRCRGDG